MRRLLYLFLTLLPVVGAAQFTYTLDQNIPVENLAGDRLRMPWAGGLNAAQFNTMDLNGDNVDDLVIFDRMANKVITFLAVDNQYLPAPDFENLFPTDIYNWVLLRDFNCDGKKDIFTGDVLGMKVYKNTTTSPGQLEWTRELFSTGFPGSKSQVLLTKNPATQFKVNLQLQFDDLPSISDVDGDGDLDIINIQYAGHTVELHQNLSMENFQSCDSLEYVRVTRAWGDFRECYCGEFAFNNAPCPPPPGGRTKHAGGKSLLAIDLNGDQQQDLIFSEAECSQLFALTNDGTLEDPVIQKFAAFPQNNPVNFVLFPAAFYEDVDFDGNKDLISSPNIFTKEFLNSQLDQSTWLYKNTGTTSNPVFSFNTRNFLQGDMIDVGDNAVPAFIDYNGDGLTDMLVSSHSSVEFTSKVYLYRNNGSVTAPSFQLVSDDYLGFSASMMYNVRIQFADIDSDGRRDLVFSATSFDNGGTNVYYLINKSETALDFSGSQIRRLNFALTSSENIYLADISGDGLPDILAGRSEGYLEYWKNNGVAGEPSFVLEEEHFLGLTPSPTRQNETVAIADLDGDGRNDLILCDQTGKVGIISDFAAVTSADDDLQYNIMFNDALKSYQAKNLGGKIWPAVVNLYNTDKPSIVVGNGLGGMHILTHDNGTSLPDQPQVNIYPNPVLKDERLKVQADRYGTMQIISLLGQQLSPPVVLQANEQYEYTLPPLAAGMYLLKFTANKKSHTQRFVVR